MADDKLFVDGMGIKWLGPKDKNRPPRTPDWVLGKMSFKCADFHKFMQQHHKDGWLNVDIKVSKNGKKYAEVDTWEPEAKKESGGDNWGEPAPQDTRDFSEGDPDEQGSTENIPF